MAQSVKQKIVNKFLGEVAKEEGLKSQVRIGNLREVFKIMDKKLEGKLFSIVALHKPTAKNGKA